MGPGGISPWSLLLILVIVLLLFGTKKLRNIGGDLGGALKGFKSAMKDGEKEANEAKEASSRTVTKSRRTLRRRSVNRRTKKTRATAAPDRRRSSRPCLMSVSLNCSSSPSLPWWWSARSVCHGSCGPWGSGWAAPGHLSDHPRRGGARSQRRGVAGDP